MNVSIPSNCLDSINHIYYQGVVSKFSRSLITASNPDGLFAAAKIAFEEMSIDGFFALTSRVASRNMKIGKGCSKDAVQTLLSEKKDNKVFSQQSCSIVKNTDITLIFCHQSEGVTPDNLDTLVTICDIAQEFSTHIAQFEHLSDDHHNKQLIAAESVHNVLQCLTSLSKHLVEQGNHIIEELHCNLLVLFPSLALEYDQEEKIIKCINSTSEEMKSLVAAQTVYNQDLKKILSDTVSALVVDFEEPVSRSNDKPSNYEQTSVDLFTDD